MKLEFHWHFILFLPAFYKCDYLPTITLCLINEKNNVPQNISKSQRKVKDILHYAKQKLRQDKCLKF